MFPYTTLCYMYQNVIYMCVLAPHEYKPLFLAANINNAWAPVLSVLSLQFLFVARQLTLTIPTSYSYA